MIEQAVYHPQPGAGWLAWSSGFSVAWRAPAERICADFGTRTGEESCPGSVFALPFPGRLVAVVQVTDAVHGLGFRLLILPHHLYRQLGGDPFHLVDQLGRPPWDERGTLPAWSADRVTASPQRQVTEVQRVLNVPHSPTLLGGVQALLDGGRLVFERREPAEDLLRSLWALLPTSSRADLWPATFAYGNALHFHVVVVPRASGPDYENYITEEKVGDYPEGTYEQSLQSAIESGNQAELDGLFARRSLMQTFWLVVILLIGFLLVALVLEVQKTESPTPLPKQAPQQRDSQPKEKESR